MIDPTDEATGLPPLALDTQNAIVPIVGQDGGEGIVSLPDGETLAVRYVNVRGVSHDADTGEVFWAQMTLALQSDVAQALLTALRSR